MRASRLSWIPLLGIIVGGIGFSWLAYDQLRRADIAKARSVLESRSEWRANDLEHKVENFAQFPLSLMALFATDAAEIADDTFRRLGMQILANHHPLQGIIWAPRVLDAERQTFERGEGVAGPGHRMISEPAADGSIIPAPRRPEYFPVTTVASTRPARLIGLDLTYEDKRRSAAYRARDEGRPQSTAPVVLANPASPDYSSLVFWPVYAGAPRTVEQRRDRLRGFVVGVFQIREVIAAAFKGTPASLSEIGFFISDDSRLASNEIHVASYDPNSDSVLTGRERPTSQFAGAAGVQRTFSVLGQDWRLVFSFSEQSLNALRGHEGWSALLVGLLFTGLLASHVFRERLRTLAAEGVADIRAADLTRASKEQEMIIDASLLAIIVLDPSYRVVIWNRAAERIFGYPAAEVIGQHHPLVPAERREEFEAIFRRVAGGEVIRDMRVSRLRRDGTLIDVIFSGVPLYDSEGRFRSAFFTLEDVTEKKAIQRQLMQAQKMEAVGQLTGGIAHDFNNMLGAVIGNLDLACERIAESDPLRRLLDDALTGALRGADLVKRLLAFARRQPLQPIVVSLPEMVANLLPLLQRALGEHIQIETCIDDAVWPVTVDPVHLENAVLNLAINARDAMPDGGTLTIDCRNFELDEHFGVVYQDIRPGNYAVITVSDTGTGMPPEVAARAFEPFFTTKGSGAGSGLGLSMVHGYAKQSGGGVKIYSEPGLGTSIRLFLPQAHAQPDAASRRSADLPAPTGSERILVVEDNPDVRKVSVLILTKLGYEVEEVESAEAAAERLERDNRFDLVFTDIVMPGAMDGIGLARRVRRLYPRIGIVLTSGFSSKVASDAEIRSLNAALIVKPYRRVDLARAVRAALDSSKAGLEAV